MWQPPALALVFWGPGRAGPGGRSRRRPLFVIYRGGGVWVLGLLLAPMVWRGCRLYSRWCADGVEGLPSRTDVCCIAARRETGTACCARRPLGCGCVRLSSYGLMRPAGRKLLASVLPPLAHRATPTLFQGPQRHNCSYFFSRWGLRRPLQCPCNFCRSNSAAALTTFCSPDSLLCAYRHRCHLSSPASPRSSARPRRACRSTSLCRQHPLI